MGNPDIDKLPAPPWPGEKKTKAAEPKVAEPQPQPTYRMIEFAAVVERDGLPPLLRYETEYVSTYEIDDYHPRNNPDINKLFDRAAGHLSGNVKRGQTLNREQVKRVICMGLTYHRDDPLVTGVVLHITSWGSADTHRVTTPLRPLCKLPPDPQAVLNLIRK
jgi:hypothetical protein